MVQELSWRPWTVFDKDPHWTLDLEDGPDSGPAYRSQRGSEDSHDSAVVVCCRREEWAAESQFFVVGDKGVGYRPAEGDIEAAVAVGQDHCSD